MPSYKLNIIPNIKLPPPPPPLLSSLLPPSSPFFPSAYVGLNKEFNHFLGLARVSLASFLLSTRTLYLSKSVRFCLLCCLAKDLPIELSANFLATFSFEMMLLSLPVRAPLPHLMTCLVSWSLRMGITCLWMASPSTKTRLSLRISTMVASLPSRGP